jgi:hypothetical protein
MPNPKSPSPELCQFCFDQGLIPSDCHANNSGNIFCTLCHQGLNPPTAQQIQATQGLPYALRKVVATILDDWEQTNTSPGLLLKSYADQLPALSETVNLPEVATLTESSLPSGRLTFKVGPELATCVLRFHTDELGSFSEASFSSPETPDLLKTICKDLHDADCPEALITIARKLISIGFQATRLELEETYRRAVLVHPGTGEVNVANQRGIIAELNFIVQP